MKLEPRQAGEAVVGGGEAEMLSGEDQAWDDPAIRVNDKVKFPTSDKVKFPTLLVAGF